MNKEYLEALNRLYECNDDDYTLGYQQHDYKLLQQALQRLESIDNSKPSEALEDLEQLAEMADKCWVSCDVHKWKITIKQALLKAQEQEKVLSIIKEKNVNVELLKDCEDRYEYNTHFPYLGAYQLTQEEFELLKAYFGKNIQK